MEGKQIPALELPVLASRERQLLHSVSGDGYYVVNVFASWCVPCRVEHALLAKISVPVYGINWKDKQNDAVLFLEQYGNPYQRVLVDVQGEAAVALGVSGVPETFLVGPDGTIEMVVKGPLDDDSVVRMLERIGA